MKIDKTKLITLDPKQERVVVVNSWQAWAHSTNELRDYLRMYLSGYKLSEIADYFDITYSSVYNALRNNVITKMSEFKPLHKINRKNLEKGDKLMTWGDYVKIQKQGEWDTKGRWVSAKLPR